MERVEPGEERHDCCKAFNAKMSLPSDSDVHLSDLPSLDDDRAPAFDLNQYPPIYDDETDLDSEERPKKKIKNLNNDERHAIYDALLQRSDKGKLKRDTTRTVANMFSVSIRTVQRIWKMAKDNKVNGFVDVSHRRTKNCGRRRIQVDLDRIREIPLKRRTTLESMACALDTPKTSLFRLLKSGVLRRHTNPIKSVLTKDNKKARLRFCLSMLDSTSLPNDPRFISMHNIVHNGEKWVHLAKRPENYYLVWDEEDPF